MNRLMTSALAVALAAPVLAPALAHASEPSAVAPASNPDALASFRATQDEVLAMVHKKVGDAKLEAKVDTFLDYKWIAEQSLGGASKYAERCAPRCADFEAVLTKLIRENYLRRVRQAEKGSLAYLGQKTKDGGTKAKVDTRVSFENDEGNLQHLEIDYVMHLVDGHWQVRNMITDGVSLSKTYRYEFHKLLEEGGIDRLIEQLEKQVASIDADG